MRRKLAVLFAAAALIVPSSAALAHHEEGHGGSGGGNSESNEACPDESQNPDGTTPEENCGNGGNGQVPDTDGDGVSNNEDNCPSVANPGQEDANGFEDGEGAGDACENAPPAEEPTDTDGDGIPDETDNCDNSVNPGQEDADGDGTGDACEEGTPPTDTDGDGTPDDTDNCPTVSNPGQEDADGNGTGDACETTEPPVTTADACDVSGGDEGLSGGGTIAQQLFNGGLDVSPLTEDPEGNGAISGEIKNGGEGQPVEPVTDEVACLVDLLVDEDAAPLDP